MNAIPLLALAAFLAALSYFVYPGLFGNFAFDFLVLALVPMFILAKGGNWKKLREYGLQVGDWKWWGKWVVALLLVALPIMYFGAVRPEFQSYYPRYWPASYSWTAFILYELVFGVAMFSTEFFYRGFMLFGLSKNMNPRLANLIHSFFYMLVHIGKPWMEVYYSFFAGYVFGYVDYKGKSIMPSFIMHWVASIIFDFMIIVL